VGAKDRKPGERPPAPWSNNGRELLDRTCGERPRASSIVDLELDQPFAREAYHRDEKLPFPKRTICHASIGRKRRAKGSAGRRSTQRRRLQSAKRPRRATSAFARWRPDWASAQGQCKRSRRSYQPDRHRRSTVISVGPLWSRERPLFENGIKVALKIPPCLGCYPPTLGPPSV
jgi:hypothetical protein